MKPPPIPPELAHRPTWKGLVIPYVQVVLRDGSPDFRAVHEHKRVEAITDFLCSVCGQQLTPGRVVFLAHTRAQVDSRAYHEPALHPVCADYSIAACAAIAGRLDEYSARPARSDGTPCTDPDCDCGGWVAVAPQRPEAQEREPWWRVEVAEYHGMRRNGTLVAFAQPALRSRCLG